LAARAAAPVRRRPTARLRAGRAADSPEIEGLRALVEARLAGHEVLALAARPRSIVGPLFSRYRLGHAYGTHVDNALIEGVRTDVSFTLFLSDPQSYDGGELILEEASGEEAF
jgi:PKHD-type hydroxylase